jgi:hypothetical protein
VFCLSLDIAGEGLPSVNRRSMATLLLSIEWGLKLA